MKVHKVRLVMWLGRKHREHNGCVMVELYYGWIYAQERGCGGRQQDKRRATSWGNWGSLKYREDNSEQGLWMATPSQSGPTRRCCQHLCIKGETRVWLWQGEKVRASWLLPWRCCAWNSQHGQKTNLRYQTDHGLWQISDFIRAGYGYKNNPFYLRSGI